MWEEPPTICRVLEEVMKKAEKRMKLERIKFITYAYMEDKSSK